MKGGAKAHSLTDGWMLADNGGPEFYWQNAKRGAIRVHFAAGDADDAPIVAAADGWHLVQQLSTFTGDVVVAILAALVAPETGDAPKYPNREAVCIKLGSLLRTVGILRWGAERLALCERIVREIALLQRLRFDLIDFPVRDPTTGRWNSRGVSIQEIPLFECLPSEPSEANLAGHAATPDSVFHIRVGDWSRWWLNTDGKVWLCHLHRALTRLDHRYNRGPEVFAKKIGLHASLLWGAIRPNEILVRRVDRLLADIGELVVDYERGTHWAGRTRERMDDALMILGEIGVLEDVIWQNGLGPGGTDRQKGWVSKWLISKVGLRLAEPLENASKPSPRSQPRRRRRRKPQLDLAARSAEGKAIRETRVTLGIGQSDLAAEFGVSPSYLSQIENNRRQASPRLAQKISAWLAANATT